ncbi:MAG TPA: circadian clock protein KaiC [Hanamia sp.]|nr:circadian clock protein KaiC [Hanamia sp.]
MKLSGKKPENQTLQKAPTGIAGLDEITAGGLPKGRPTLICGDAGSGKTVFSMEFIVKGAMEYNEPGVFVAFEEKSEELAINVASLGFDLNKLIAAKKIKIDHIHIDRSEIEETGEYDLEGLFIRLSYAIESIGAKRVVLDTIENLFSGLTNHGILRAELRRLFAWLKEKGVTAIITGEKGDGKLTRQGLEEYVSDCVILLDHRIQNQISTRRLRIIKYRGSVHGTNEYPFLIDEDGISVLPITSLSLSNKVSSQRVSSGIPALDEMLEGKGFYKGSSILVSGTAGSGKTSIAAYFANAACMRKERCLFFAFEESPEQIMRNMRSINLNLEQHVKSGLLQFYSSRPTLYGLEMHLVVIYKLIRQFKPKMVVLDPITNLVTVGDVSEVKSILTRLIDFLQKEQITVMFTALTSAGRQDNQADEDVSSLVDAWISVRDMELNGERNRGIYILKSRGMKNSNQVREFIITDHGIEIVDVALGPNGVLIGSARELYHLEKIAGEALQQNALDRKNKEIENKRLMLESKIAALNSEFELVKDELNRVYFEGQLRQDAMEKNRSEMTRKRQSRDARIDKRKK